MRIGLGEWARGILETTRCFLDAHTGSSPQAHQLVKELHVGKLETAKQKPKEILDNKLFSFSPGPSEGAICFSN